MKSSHKIALTRSCSAKSKLIWTSELRDKFQKAVEKLGIDNAVPKKILELMKVKGLTRDNVASHLQKYRIVKKRLAASQNGVVITSKLNLLESSMTNEAASWMNSASMLNEQPKNGPSSSGIHKTTNLPILDTSSTYVPVVEASKVFNPEFELAYQGSYDMGVANLLNSNSGFVQSCDGFTNSYKDCLAEVDSYNNIEMDSSSGVHLNDELEMTWNHENQIIAGDSMSSYFVENRSSSESNYSRQSEFVETGWMYGASSRDDMESEIGELDLIWNGGHIDDLLSCGNDNRKYQSISNNLPLSIDLQNQVVAAEEFLLNDSFDQGRIHSVIRTYLTRNPGSATAFDSYENEATTSNNLHQTLDGYIHDFDHTSNMDVINQKSPNIIPFGTNEELRSINEVHTTDENLPSFDQTFHMNNVTLDSPNQDEKGQYFLDNFAFDLNESTSINEDQTSAGFLSSFDPTYNMQHNDELIEPIWSPEPITNDLIRQGYF